MLAVITAVHFTACSHTLWRGRTDYSYHLYHFAEKGEDSAMVYYKIIGKDEGHPTLTAVVSRNQAMGETPYEGVISIPSEVKYSGRTYKVVGIQSEAFANCINLTGISLPSSIESISDYAFIGCSNLRHVKVAWKQPPEISANVFKTADVITVMVGTEQLEVGRDISAPVDCDLRKCTLHVPQGTAHLYRQAEGWKDFGQIVEE